MRDDITTWHYGLVARWWAEFEVGGEAVEYFRAVSYTHLTLPTKA